MDDRHTFFRILSIVMLLGIACCSDMSYAPGKSAGDIPAPITAIYLENVAPLNADFFDARADQKDALPYNPSPSSDDLFISKLVKADIARDLIRQGCTVTEDAAEPHDIVMAVFLFYQPDDWPFANRFIHIRANINEPNGMPLFHIDKSQTNLFGPLGDHMGFSSEAMLSTVAQDITTRMAEELRLYCL